MKKKILPLALAAAAGLTGINSAHAVNVNSDGLGQVLIYPFFTTEGGQDTNIALVNTTDKVKAVKIRFLESMNSQEVLDFNIYLSPQDHWSGAITSVDRTAEGYGAGSGGAKLITRDTSCTAPVAVGSQSGEASEQKFLTFAFGATDDNKTVARTQEGYIEVIEMGELSLAADITAATHVAGVPGSCATLAAYFGAGGKWVGNANTDVDAPAGGLYGYASIVNPIEGTASAYDAVALDAYSALPLHSNPGNLDPSLASGTTDSLVFDGSATVVAGDFTGNRLPSTNAQNGLDAVSSVLMHSAISNDYIIDRDLGAATSWVVTFPTKRDYVAGTAADFPFTDNWDGKNACEPVVFTYYDREELGRTPDGLAVSPRPPGDAPASLCYEANVIDFDGFKAIESSTRSALSLDLEDTHTAGWMTIDFRAQTGMAAGARTLVDDGGITFTGLPVVGFAVQEYKNGVVDSAVRSFEQSIAHKGTVTVTTP